MERLTETQVRASFVNATKGEAARMNLPSDFEAKPWGELDLLAWVDPQAPLNSYLVVPTSEQAVVGVRLRRAKGGGATRRSRMCSLCTTTHAGQGVALMVAPRAGRRGREGNTVGLEICVSLECSAYARGTRRPPPSLGVLSETLTAEERVARLRSNVLAFVDRVMAA